MGLDELKQALRAKYPGITQDEFAAAQGDRAKLVSLVVEKTGASEDEAKSQIDEIFSANQ